MFSLHPALHPQQNLWSPGPFGSTRDTKNDSCSRRSQSQTLGLGPGIRVLHHHHGRPSLFSAGPARAWPARGGVAGALLTRSSLPTCWVSSGASVCTAPRSLTQCSLLTVAKLPAPASTAGASLCLHPHPASRPLPATEHLVWKAGL